MILLNLILHFLDWEYWKKLINLEDLKCQISKTLPIKSSLLEQIKDEEALLQLIALYIQELIDNDFEKLLHLLYRIDIPDYKVKKAVEKSSLGNAPIVIANLILEREKEKIASRKKFNFNKEKDDWIFDI